MWPGCDYRTHRHMWDEFIVDSRPCSKGLSPGPPVLLPQQKSTIQILIRSLHAHFLVSLMHSLLRGKTRLILDTLTTHTFKTLYVRTFHKVLDIYLQHFKGGQLTKCALRKVADFILL